MRSRPDFYLCETASGSQVLTPFSALGRMAYDGIKGPFRSIGDALLLSQEEGSFVLQVLQDNHYRVIQRPFECKPSSQTFTTTAVDTRPVLSSRPFLGHMHGLLQQQPLTKRDLDLLESLRRYRPGGKQHTFSLAPYLHRMTEL